MICQLSARIRASSSHTSSLPRRIRGSSIVALRHPWSGLKIVWGGSSSSEVVTCHPPTRDPGETGAARAARFGGLARGGRTVLAVVFGKVCNHARLRSELTALGHRFTSRGNSESSCVPSTPGARAARLEGMFAYAAWKPGSRRLARLRDRFGIKPRIPPPEQLRQCQPITAPPGPVA
ncbi:hypothetical protein [Streptomyces sp. NPDC002962]|uniref:hypothetical protein n=1 Tax=Streptomyces sp. NPDC002962 TaxID=3364674 RepID=UPI0036B5C256